MSAIIQAFKDADLRKKIIFTLVMIIAYRIGAQIPTPGVDYASITAQLRQLTQESGDLYSVINLFSGGALLQLSVLQSALCRTLRLQLSSSSSRLLFPTSSN